MASVKLEHIYKVYSNGTKAVNDLSLDIQNGEFIVFVGPSGCGKSTTLRMIAGLEEITAGELYIDNQIVNDVEPKDRDIAMVFQNYALYPHMTVYDNMAFGLRLRHVPDDIIQEKVLWAADILGIKEYLDRKPRAMSGGQRQRVALGRAILRDPKVMLLDEPLSNLDAKLRTQMRTEIAKLHQKLKTTFIYVTHDQTEAMTLGDRVVVMKAGRIQQVDTPKNLYDHPSNIFVAGFIGTPQMNFFDCHLKREADKVNITLADSDSTLSVPRQELIKVQSEYLDGEHDIVLGIRCEHISFTTIDDPDAIEMTINHFEELGSECLIYGVLGKKDEGVVSERGQIIIKTDTTEGLEPGKVAYVRFDLEHTYFFDKETEETITPRIPKVDRFTCDIKDGRLVFGDTSIKLPETLEHDDIADLTLEVGTDLFFEDEDGIIAKVAQIEKINDVKLYHLSVGDDIFFAILDSDHDIGDEIKIGFDFSKITLTHGDEVIFSPLKPYDDFKAAFYNYQTIMSKGDYPQFKELRDGRMNRVRDEYDAKLEEEENEYQNNIASLESLDEETRAGLRRETEEFISANKEKIAELKKESKATLGEKKKEFKKEKKRITAENDALFKKKKEDELAAYKKFKASTNDKETLKRRSDEYHMFKDNFSAEKEATLNDSINTIAMDYESQVSSIKAATRRQINSYKTADSDKKKELKRKIDGRGYLDKAHQRTSRRLQTEKKNAIDRASLVFFFRFTDSYYAVLTDTISNKLIQGLGTRVFDKEFKVEIPHDAYSLTDSDNSLRGTVVGHLDYQNVIYNEVRLSDRDDVIFVKSDSILAEDSEVRLDIDITKVQITETDMNIRLY